MFMPDDVQPLDRQSIPPVTKSRPVRLIVQVYLAGALCVFVLVLDVRSGFDWETRHLATVRTAIGLYGLIMCMICFVRGALRQSDKWLLAAAGLLCLAFGALAMLMPRLTIN
jgi:hypothetical protein